MDLKNINKTFHPTHQNMHDSHIQRNKIGHIPLINLTQNVLKTHTENTGKINLGDGFGNGLLDTTLKH